MHGLKLMKVEESGQKQTDPERISNGEIINKSSPQANIYNWSKCLLKTMHFPYEHKKGLLGNHQLTH
ncbi:hypothetical protein YC2023_017822 [Brassica napus]